MRNSGAQDASDKHVRTAMVRQIGKPPGDFIHDVGTNAPAFGESIAGDFNGVGLAGAAGGRWSRFRQRATDLFDRALAAEARYQGIGGGDLAILAAADWV